MIELLNMDCMDYMREQLDKSFDLAIVDPPYGIGADKQKPSISPSKNGNRRRIEWDGHWDDKTPEDTYFIELERISKNRIIWGGNYFNMKPSRCWLIWDKVQEFSGADFEMAWTSFNSSAKAFRYPRCMMHHYPDGENRIHPTQKPVKLYEWLLTNYAEPGQRILDTHLGSGSSAIAAHYFGVDFVGIEIDEDYYNAAVERFNNETAQEALF